MITTFHTGTAVRQKTDDIYAIDMHFAIKVVRKKVKQEHNSMKVMSTGMSKATTTHGGERKGTLSHESSLQQLDVKAILQLLQHPFLLPLTCSFQTEDCMYFALSQMNHGDDGTLYDHLKMKRRFTEHEARYIVSCVALALGHLHSIHVDMAHGDVKPENIIIEYDTGHVYLTDLGFIPSCIDAINEDGTAVMVTWTPEYIAPEVINKRDTDTRHADWWSFGVLLYELTVGIPPFYSRNISEMYRKIREAPLLFPPFSNDKCKCLIRQCLERDPRKRLGCGPRDVEDIKEHPFFDTMGSWDKLLLKQVKPPFVPRSFDDEHMGGFIDRVFLPEPVFSQPVVNSSVSVSNGDGFEGFTYVPSGP